MKELDWIKKDLREKLSEKRYLHSLRVAEEAKKLAYRYHLDENQAYIGGLVHDVAKEFNEKENRKWIEKYHLPLNFLKPEFHKILHAEVGAVVALELYGVNEAVAQAIRYHTIGNVKMTLFDKIIFVADKIESGKSYPGIEEERILAYQDIDKSLALCLKNQKKKLEWEGKVFYQDALEFLQFLEEKSMNVYK